MNTNICVQKQIYTNRKQIFLGNSNPILVFSSHFPLNSVHLLKVILYWSGLHMRGPVMFSNTHGYTWAINFTWALHRAISKWQAMQPHVTNVIIIKLLNSIFLLFTLAQHNGRYIKRYKHYTINKSHNRPILISDHCSEVNELLK
jgi:hypothetical protein